MEDTVDDTIQAVENDMVVGTQVEASNSSTIIESIEMDVSENSQCLDHDQNEPVSESDNADEIGLPKNLGVRPVVDEDEDTNDSIYITEEENDNTDRTKTPSKNLKEIESDNEIDEVPIDDSDSDIEEVEYTADNSDNEVETLAESSDNEEKDSDDEPKDSEDDEDQANEANTKVDDDVQLEEMKENLHCEISSIADNNRVKPAEGSLNNNSSLDACDNETKEMVDDVSVEATLETKDCILSKSVEKEPSISNGDSHVENNKLSNFMEASPDFYVSNTKTKYEEEKVNSDDNSAELAIDNDSDKFYNSMQGTADSLKPTINGGETNLTTERNTGTHLSGSVITTNTTDSSNVNAKDLENETVQEKVDIDNKAKITPKEFFNGKNSQISKQEDATIDSSCNQDGVTINTMIHSYTISVPNSKEIDDNATGSTCIKETGLVDDDANITINKRNGPALVVHENKLSITTDGQNKSNEKIDENNNISETRIKPRSVSEEIAKLEFNNVGWVDSSSDAVASSSTNIDSTGKDSHELSLPNTTPKNVEPVHNPCVEPDSPHQSDEESKLESDETIEVPTESNLESAVSSSVTETLTFVETQSLSHTQGINKNGDVDINEIVDVDQDSNEWYDDEYEDDQFLPAITSKHRKEEETTVTVNEVSNSTHEDKDVTSENEPLTDEDDYDENESRPSSGYLPSPKTDLPSPFDISGSPRSTDESPFDSMTKWKQNVAFPDSNSNVHSTVDLEQNSYGKGKISQNCWDAERGNNKYLDRTLNGEFKRTDQYKNMYVVSNGMTKRPQGEDKDAITGRLVIDEANSIEISKQDMTTPSTSIFDLNNNMISQDLHYGISPENEALALTNRELPDLLNGEDTKRKFRGFEGDALTSKGIRYQTLRVWDGNDEMTESEKWEPTPNRTKAENLMIQSDALHSLQSQNKRKSELFDAPQKKKKMVYSDTVSDAQVVQDIETTPQELLNNSDTSGSHDAMVDEKSSKTEHCRRRLNFDSPHVDQAYLNTECYMELDTRDLKLLETNSHFCNEDNENGLRSEIMKNPRKITEEMSTFVRECKNQTNSIPPFQKHQFQNGSFMPQGRENSFNQEAFLAYMLFNQINSNSENSGISQNNSFENNTSSQSDINNNLADTVAPKQHLRPIVNNTNPSILNKFWWTSYMAQMERLNFLWGPNAVPLQMAHHQENVNQALKVNTVVNGDASIASQPKVESAAEKASNRIDKAIDVWVYAAKNNDKVTRDAAHREFLASVSSAAAASFSKEEIIPCQNETLTENTKVMIKGKSDEIVDMTGSRKRNIGEVEIEEVDMATGTQRDIMLGSEECDALNIEKESIAKRLKLEEVTQSNPLNLHILQKDNDPSFHQTFLVNK